MESAAENMIRYEKWPPETRTRREAALKALHERGTAMMEGAAADYSRVEELFGTGKA